MHRQRRLFFADSRFVIGLLDEFNIEETEGLENAYLLGISTILTAFFDHWEKMLDASEFDAVACRK